MIQITIKTLKYNNNFKYKNLLFTCQIWVE